MKKLAIIVASLICFAGCARNDTDTPTAAAEDSGATDTMSASGSAGSSQVGQETGVNRPSATGFALTNGSPSSLSDTNTNSLNSLPPQPMPPPTEVPSAIQPEPSGNNSQSPQASPGNDSYQSPDRSQTPPQP